jgi:MFS family permease
MPPSWTRVLVLVVAFAAPDIYCRIYVALPSIEEDLAFSNSGLSWVVNAYVIPFGGLLLLAGRFGDLLGQRRIFLGGLALFTAASLLCAAAQTQEMLIVARFLQGAARAFASAVVSVGRLRQRPEPSPRTGRTSAVACGSRWMVAAV